MTKIVLLILFLSGTNNVFLSNFNKNKKLKGPGPN